MSVSVVKNLSACKAADLYSLNEMQRLLGLLCVNTVLEEVRSSGPALLSWSTFVQHQTFHPTQVVLFPRTCWSLIVHVSF